MFDKKAYKKQYCIEHSKEHIIPIGKGGNNIRENIVPACIVCNSSKGNKVLIGGIYGLRRSCRQNKGRSSQRMG